VIELYDLGVSVSQLFKYFEFNQSMSVLAMSINRSTRDLIYFSIMFSVVFLAFAQFSYIIFGTHMQDFSTFGDSVYAASFSAILQYSTI